MEEDGWRGRRASGGLGKAGVGAAGVAVPFLATLHYGRNLKTRLNRETPVPHLRTVPKNIHYGLKFLQSRRYASLQPCKITVKGSGVKTGTFPPFEKLVFQNYTILNQNIKTKVVL